MGPYSDWLVVSRDGAVKVHHLQEKKKQNWLREPGDLMI